MELIGNDANNGNSGGMPAMLAPELGERVRPMNWSARVPDTGDFSSFCAVSHSFHQADRWQTNPRVEPGPIAF